MHYLTRTDLRAKLRALETKLKVTFKNKTLLEEACVHTSYVNENRGESQVHNERLEFLGDAVLELVATEFLYAKFPDKHEGDLTAFRSALVQGRHLADVARRLELGQFLLLSHGEEKSGGRDKNYLLANLVESLIGAIYLDRGFAVAHRFIDRAILIRVDDLISQGLHIDAKSHLQEFAQEKMGLTPNYKVLSQSGPDHNRTFEVGAFIGEELVGKGTGSSKQKAEQSAAQDALENRSLLTR